MIRRATKADRAQVLEQLLRYVAETPYGTFLTDPYEHAKVLYKNGLEAGVVLVDEVDGRLLGCIVICITSYMGATLAEEVGWCHETPRGLLALARQAECQAVQQGATVLKMSAPAWTQLDGYYTRHGFEKLESVYVKVIPHGMGERRHRSGRPRRGGGESLRQEEERG